MPNHLLPHSSAAKITRRKKLTNRSSFIKRSRTIVVILHILEHSSASVLRGAVTRGNKYANSEGPSTSCSLRDFYLDRISVKLANSNSSTIAVPYCVCHNNIADAPAAWHTSYGFFIARDSKCIKKTKTVAIFPICRLIIMPSHAR